MYGYSPDSVTIGVFGDEEARGYKVASEVITWMQQQGFRYVGAGGVGQKVQFNRQVSWEASRMDLCFTQEELGTVPLQQVIWVECPGTLVAAIEAGEIQASSVLPELATLDLTRGRVALSAPPYKA